MKCVWCQETVSFDDLGRARCQRAWELGLEKAHHAVTRRHKPTGNPCGCGRAAADHIVSHISRGDPCGACGLPGSCHEVRKSVRSEKLMAALLRRDGINCQICGKRLPVKVVSHLHGDSVQIDHIVPVAKGGGDDLDNLRLAHRSCNISRGADGWTPRQRAAMERAQEYWATQPGGFEGALMQMAARAKGRKAAAGKRKPAATKRRKKTR
jgi:5-methylcytosine-specific restriction endonuclease McrA